MAGEEKWWLKVWVDIHQNEDDVSCTKYYKILQNITKYYISFALG